MRKAPIVAIAALAAVTAAGVTGVTRTSHAQPSSGEGPGFMFPTVTPGAPSDGMADMMVGEILIDLRDDVSTADEASFAKTYGLQGMHPNSSWSEANDKYEIADVDADAEDTLITRMASDPRVEHVEGNAIYRASFVPNDPLYESKQWHLKRVGAESAWEYTCGEGVTVAVIDTGIACYDSGPFMKGTDLAGTRCVDGYNFVDNKVEASDDHGHGTHVAGTIAQTTNNGVGVAGLAYCAKLMPIKVLSKGGFGTTANVAEGIRFAADHGAQVINMSLGGPIKSRILEDAIKHAMSKNVVIVAAAGNSGRDVGYPAAYPGVIAVSATDSNDKIAWFSSRGPEVVIAAPGVAVTQQTVCQNGRNKCEQFATFNGTSMASPHVAGVAAMLESMGVTDADAVRSAMTSTARPQGDAKLFGAGILDGGAAAQRVFLWHLALRLGALIGLFALLAAKIKKSGGSMPFSKRAAFGALFTSVGLVPILPLLKVVSHAGSFRWLAELAMRPLGEWDLAFDAGIHRWLPLASALPVMVLTAFFFGSKKGKPFIGGAAIGTAALLAQLALSGDTAYALGPVMMRVWAVANALLCLWIARMTLDKKKA